MEENSDLNRAGKDGFILPSKFASQYDVSAARSAASELNAKDDSMISSKTQGNESAISNGTTGKDQISLISKNAHFTFPISCFTLPTLVDDGKCPSLSIAQLTILALVLSPGRILSIPRITKWIMGTCSFYKDLAYYHTANKESTLSLINVIEKLLHQYDFPTTPVYAGGDNDMLFHLDDGGEWSILPKTGRIVSKPFQLLKLPRELRLVIYHWTLYRGLPRKHGWVIDPQYTASSQILFKKDSHEPKYLHVIGPGEWELRTPRIDEVLALLSVNKQIKVEATPVFYRSNAFYFDSCRTLHDFLSGMPTRFRFIRHIILNYDPPPKGGHCARTFILLRETKVRNIHIFVDEDELMDRNVGFGTVDRLPGMREFGRLRGLHDISFEGSSQGIIAYLARHGVENNKRDDSTDDDERAVLKFKNDQKGNLFEMKKARKERIKKDRSEARVAKAEEDKKAREDKKRFRAEAKAEREEKHRIEKEARQAVAAKKKKKILELKTKRSNQMQKSERAKAAKYRTDAAGRSSKFKKRIQSSKGTGTRLVDTSSASSEVEESETESEDDESPPPIKKAKRNSVLTEKRSTQATKTTRTKYRDVVGISSDHSFSDETSGDERSSSPAPIMRNLKKPVPRFTNKLIAKSKTTTLKGKGRGMSRPSVSRKARMRKTCTGPTKKVSITIQKKSQLGEGESDLEWK
jgi:hypothetical protein